MKKSLFEGEDDDFENAYDYALRLLEYSPQTEKILADKMKIKKYPPEIIRRVCEKLTENSLLKDYEVAGIYADNLVKIKNLGFNSIVVKLKQKGIGSEMASQIAKEALENNGGEEALLRKYIEKNFDIPADIEDRTRLEKMKQKLSRRGFGLSRINEAIKNFTDLA